MLIEIECEDSDDEDDEETGLEHKVTVVDVELLTLILSE